MTAAEYKVLRDHLRADVIDEPFELLATIAAHYSRAEDAGDRDERYRARDLVIRCVERADDLEPVRELLDALVARAGLFPYLEAERLGFADRFAYEAHRPLTAPVGRETMVFHGVQAEVYARLMDRHSVVLTAPTSFGKSVIIDALVVSGRFDNIVVIVPTIALIDEARRRLTRASVSHKVITGALNRSVQRCGGLALLSKEVVWPGSGVRGCRRSRSGICGGGGRRGSR